MQTSPHRSRNVRVNAAVAMPRRPFAAQVGRGGGGLLARVALRVLASAALGASLAVIGVGISGGLGAPAAAGFDAAAAMRRAGLRQVSEGEGMGPRRVVAPGGTERSAQPEGGGESAAPGPPRDDALPSPAGRKRGADPVPAAAQEASRRRMERLRALMGAGPPPRLTPVSGAVVGRAHAPSSPAGLSSRSAAREPTTETPSAAVQQVQHPAAPLHSDDLDEDATVTIGSGASSAREADPFFGGEVDLAAHRSNNECWDHFDFGHLETWGASARLFCDAGDSAPAYLHGLPASSLSGGGGASSTLAEAVAPSAQGSWLRCRVTVDAHLPPATSPHTLCDGANIVLDTSLLSPTSCLPSRPGYKCDGPPVHWNWGGGALSGACAPIAEVFTPQAFPNDHLKDMFASWLPDGAAKLSRAQLADIATPAAPITLLVAREREEHANAFHATTDLINAFMTLHAAGVIDGVGGRREGMEHVQVLMLDEQMGPFDETLWRRVFSPAHPMMRVSSLKNSAAPRLRLPRALFVPPGYTNMLLSHVSSEGDCHAGTQLFQSYRRFVLGGLGLIGEGEAPATGAARAGNSSAPIRVTFVSRRPYKAFVDHSFVGRQIDNEEELLAVAATIAGADVQRVDFATMDAVEQVRMISRTDVLVGMHGAALTHSLYLPHHAGVLELWPKPYDIWRCFEHIAAMSGLSYVRWANSAFPGAGFRQDERGDYTTVQVDEFATMLRELVATTKARRDRGLS